MTSCIFQPTTLPYCGRRRRTLSPPRSGPCTTWWPTQRWRRSSVRSCWTSCHRAAWSSAATETWRSPESSWTNSSIWVPRFAFVLSFHPLTGWCGSDVFSHVNKFKTTDTLAGSQTSAAVGFSWFVIELSVNSNLGSDLPPQTAPSRRVSGCPLPPWTSVWRWMTSVCGWMASARWPLEKAMLWPCSLRLYTWTLRSTRSLRYRSITQQ